MSVAKIYRSYQKFLIRPAERLQFVGLFVLLTWGVHSGFEWFLQALYYSNWPAEKTNFLLENISVSFLDGGLRGLIQWLVLRPYFADTRWILATALSATFAGVVDQINNTGWDLQTMPENLIWMLLINGSLTIASLIFLVVSQWLVLRSHVKNAHQWLIAVLLGIFLSILFQGLINLTWLIPERGCFHISLYAPAIFWAVQAIAFCFFRRKTAVEKNVLGLEPQLADAEGITNFKKLRTLAQLVKDKIQQTWKTDFSTTLRLRYWLAVGENGAIVEYKPLNQAASNYVAETPLPALLPPENREKLALGLGNAIAQFEVIFTPPSSFQVLPLTQPSLIRISLGMLLLVLLMSSAPTLQCFWELI